MKLIKYGISAAHVTAGVFPGPIASHFDGTEEGQKKFSEMFPTVDRIDLSCADVALLRLPADFVATNCVNFSDLGVHDPREGETVYKIGARTGFTVGKLEATQTTWKDHTTGKTYDDVVAVAWEDGERFADFGDCGSLYFLKRGSTYPVLAIHRQSNDAISYGTNFNLAMDMLLPSASTEFRFLNPDSL